MIEHVVRYADKRCAMCVVLQLMSPVDRWLTGQGLPKKSQCHTMWFKCCFINFTKMVIPQMNMKTNKKLSYKKNPKRGQQEWGGSVLWTCYQGKLYYGCVISELAGLSLKPPDKTSVESLKEAKLSVVNTRGFSKTLSRQYRRVFPNSQSSIPEAFPKLSVVNTGGFRKKFNKKK